MKRILILIMLLLLTACEPDLIDCKDNQEVGGYCIDTTPPVLSGINDVVLYQNDSFNKMSNVTAEDDLDGDVTARIVTTGSVDTSEFGTYLIKYIVTDLQGNEAIGLRYITVTYDPNSLDIPNLVQNGSFDDGLQGYETLNDLFGGFGTFTIVDGVLNIDISAVADGVWWEPRLDYQNMTFEQNQTYFVSFRIKADEDRFIQVQIGELLSAEPWFTRFNNTNDLLYFATDEWTTYEFTFTMNHNTNYNGCILFEFGDVTNHTNETIVYLDDITIQAID